MSEIQSRKLEILVKQIKEIPLGTYRIFSKDRMNETIGLTPDFMKKYFELIPEVSYGIYPIFPDSIRGIFYIFHCRPLLRRVIIEGDLKLDDYFKLPDDSYILKTEWNEDKVLVPLCDRCNPKSDNPNYDGTYVELYKPEATSHDNHRKGEVYRQTKYCNCLKAIGYSYRGIFRKIN